MAGTNSEARKAHEEQAARHAAEHERKREVVALALNGVYSGAGYLEADALLDQLADLGARVEVEA